MLMDEFKCTRCGKEFDVDETLDAYDELGFMLYVKRSNGQNMYETEGGIIPLCHDCTLKLNEFVYG